MKINVENIVINQKYKSKIVVISDIHHIKSCDDKFYNEILETIRKIKPKYILSPGDIVEHPKFIQDKSIKYLINFITNLALIAPVIISKGNHEIKTNLTDIKALYRKLDKLNNVYILDNKSIILGDYQFIGFSPSNKSYFKKYKSIWQQNFIEEANKCNFKTDNQKTKILLCHSPSVVISDEVQKNVSFLKNIDYIICGHMHNGLTPKFLDNTLKTKGLFGPEYIFFPKYCRGVHKLNNNGKLIVCKSLRALTKDNILFKSLDKLYYRNITFIEI